MTVGLTQHHAARLAAAAAGVVMLCLLSPEAAAQFGGIFGDPPLRPPGSVPGGRPQPREQVPQQRQPQQQDQFPERLPPGPPPSSSRRAPAPVQSEQLPPPPGARETQQASPALPPGIRAPRGTPQPANTAPQPGDEVVPAPATQKIPNQAAVFSGLDKITGRIINFDVAIGETVQFGALQVLPRVCYTRPPTEAAATDAFIEVSEVTLQGEVRRIFAGWMFAASPGLNAVEHPIYDVWLTDCKQPLVKVAEDPPLPAPQQQATPAPRQPQSAQQPRPRPQQQQQQQQPSQQPSQQQRAFPTPIR